MPKTDCVPCRVATALGITRDICKEYKEEVDCHELEAITEHPENYSPEEAEKVIAKLAENAKGKAKELVACVVKLMHGEECE